MEIAKGYPRLSIAKKTGDEVFHGAGVRRHLDLRGFWQWAGSDLVSNTMRGVLAEYIVATALGVAVGVRTEWDAYDLRTADGIRVEVKSGSYIQSWHHEKLSKIIFSIRPTRGWDAKTNTYSELGRQADVYVFCVLATQEQEKLDPLDLDQWEFHVLAARVLDAACPVQKTIGLSRLKNLNPISCSYAEIGDAVRRAAGDA